MRTASFIVVCLHCIYGLVSPEEHDRERRGLSMLRMGKRGMEDLPPLVPPNYEVGDEYEERALIIPENGVPRQIWVPRIGKDIDDEGRYIRHPPFPRVGKIFEEYLNEIRRDINDDDLRNLLMKYTQHASRRRRSVDEDDQAVEDKKDEHKRAAAFPRIGLRDEEINEQERSFPRIGLQERAFPRIGLREEQIRAMPFPRLGLRELEDEYSENEIERALPFPRIGLEERALAFPRMGYRDKKAMGMLRMGRSNENAFEDEEKRGMSMLRMGKRAMSMLRMGKRPVSMLRMGRAQDTSSYDEEKRAMGMLRMGKRAMGMLRMGRSSEADMDEEKRAMGMLRMGKRGMSMLRMGRSDNSETADKRAMGMLRMGRSEPQEEEKRAMSMLRMGKRPVSMLRMGKRDTGDVQSASDAMDDLIAKESS